MYCTTSISIVLCIGNCSDANISNVYVLIDNKIVFEKHSQPNKEKLFSYDPRGCLFFPFQALVEWLGEIVRHFPLATQITPLMQGTKVQTIDLAIPIAILTILIHIVLDGVGGTLRIIHTVGKGCEVFGSIDINMDTCGHHQPTILRQCALVGQCQLSRFLPETQSDAKDATCSVHTNRLGIASTGRFA